MNKFTDKQVLAAWEKSGTIKGVARLLGVQDQKAQRLLLTAGVKINSPITRRINDLRAQGLNIGQIAQLMGMSRQGVMAHLPYDRGQLSYWSNSERQAAISGGDIPGRSREAIILQRHRIKASQRIRHDTPLRRARLAAGLTQAELSQKSGISISYVQKIERGTQNPESMSLDVLRALADAIGCDMKKLYETSK